MKQRRCLEWYFSDKVIGTRFNKANQVRNTNKKLITAWSLGLHMHVAKFVIPRIYYHSETDTNAATFAYNKEQIIICYVVVLKCYQKPNYLIPGQSNSLLSAMSAIDMRLLTSSARRNGGENYAMTLIGHVSLITELFRGSSEESQVL